MNDGGLGWGTEGFHGSDGGGKRLGPGGLGGRLLTPFTLSEENKTHRFRKIRLQQVVFFASFTRFNLWH